MAGEGLPADLSGARVTWREAQNPMVATPGRAGLLWLNVGGALVSEVVLEILRLDPDVYHDLVVRSGEIGEGIAKVWNEDPAVRPLSLADLCKAFDALGFARTRGGITAALAAEPFDKAARNNERASDDDGR